MHKRSLFVLIMLVVSFISVACSNTNEEKVSKETTSQTKKDHEQHSEVASGDIREETTSNGVLPEFLKDKSEDMQVIYADAAQNKELLENIPCYCGCGESAGHKNNYDCFIYKNKEDGKVVWDDHGTKCGVCLEIAAQSVSDLKSGKSIKQIRQSIDEKYKSGYAKPTPTPTPEV
ncbi:PCYCGC motif-containing (lipo)protein (plasmid) [Priestia megaterium]|uniref:PCYCGC motif-containing (lipo)protein n=1 Tax=Priestia megaterium TaxID=1404 RepID=UPI0022865BA2|nr:PCYCGC motif-containing (lipo)protein [Priestia megaterium]